LGDSAAFANELLETWRVSAKRFRSLALVRVRARDPTCEELNPDKMLNSLFMHHGNYGYQALSQSSQFVFHSFWKSNQYFVERVSIELTSKRVYNGHIHGPMDGMHRVPLG
jgi:hypothetical protein